MPMFNFLRKKPDEVKQEPKASRKSFWSTHVHDREQPLVSSIDIVNELINKQPIAQFAGTQDDSSTGIPDLKMVNSTTALSEALAMWYASQSFIGHQLCAILSQNWLIQKACSMPARDAIRNGYSIATVSGDKLPADASSLLQQYDRRFNVRKSMEEFVTFGRVFGIRIALFKVESTDPDYYEKPFNPDGITPGSYKGIVQIDPYWCAPMLDGAAASRPDTLHFYEPTYWMINGQKHHRTHLVIFRNGEVPDLLKPQYLYGGVPVPQQIMERVYAAERVANEAPQLAQTKRTNIWLTDMEKFASKGDAAIEAINQWTYYRDNYGVKLGDKDGDEFAQFDTSLADLDEVIMTQYQIVAAASRVPATKLMGTQPKGFNSTGDYEESSYHEELESIQYHDLTPLLERHHMLVMRSYVVPMLEIEVVETIVNWEPLDSPTAKEVADTNLVKAQTGQVLIASGAISSEDENRRVATDDMSGYDALGIDDGEDETD